LETAGIRGQVQHNTKLTRSLQLMQAARLVNLTGRRSLELHVYVSNVYGIGLWVLEVTGYRSSSRLSHELMCSKH
jgi:hypothetical protein